MAKFDGCAFQRKFFFAEIDGRRKPSSSMVAAFD